MFSSKRKLLGILIFSLFCALGFCEEAQLTTITITNARQTTYKKDEESGNDTIVLEGNVILRVKKGSSDSEIKADRITYDRKTEMLYADGNVEIVTKTSSSGGEVTTANSLLLNTSTLEGVFDGGRVVQTKSDAINLPSGSTLIVFSDVFGKSENNTIAFKNSSLTFCDAEDPHWHIDSSRTWLLPGGEFAFLNALLYVGPVPVLYLPAFYYPKDELVFNPAFGYNSRSGKFVQTTTYIVGRKPLDSSNSSYGTDNTAAEESIKALYNFMKPSSLKVQERQGLVMHNLDEDYTGNTSQYLKVMADFYSNLGFMAGVDGKFAPSKDYITNLNFNVDLGFSKTLFGSGSSWTAVNNNKVYWDKSNFMGLKLPFRYGANIDLTLSKPFKLTLALPIYSDPYFNDDFNKRSESTDWISYFMTKNQNTDYSPSSVSSFTWKLNASYSPKIPEVLKPYISSLSFSENSSINVSYKGRTDWKGYSEELEKNTAWQNKTPERYFYYPSQVTPLSANASISGTLFQYPKVSSSKTKTVTYPVPLTKPDDLKTESQLVKEQEEKEKKAAEEALKKEREEAGENGEVPSENKEEPVVAEETPKEEEIEFVKPTLPDFATSVSNSKLPDGFTYKLSYSIAPNVLTQYAYDSEKLKTPEDFKWENIKSYMYTVKMPASLSSDMSYGGSFFTMSNKFSYDPVWQDHPKVPGYLDDQGKLRPEGISIKKTDYNASRQSLVNTNTVSFRPFAYIPAFAETGVSWNTSMKLYRRKFLADETTDLENPQYENIWLFDDIDNTETITAHTLNFTLAANEGNSKFKQNLTFSTTLKPQVPKYSATLNLTFPYVTSSFSYGWQETSKEDPTITKNPFQQSMTVSLFNNQLKISESYNLNIQEWEERGDGNHSDSLKLSASWKSFSASYVMNYTYGYDLCSDANNPEGKKLGWNVREEKEFTPYSLSLSYSLPSKNYTRWLNRISFAPSLSTSIVYDCIKYTNSYFSFSPSLNFKINEFFNISLSATSKNSHLYWYFHEGNWSKGLFGTNNIFPLNALYDLIASFGIYGPEGWFWKEGAFEGNRLYSSYKIQSLNLTMSHELHDWSFKFTAKIEPRRETNKESGKMEINYKPYITIGIIWNPMQSIKTEIVDKYGTWQFNKE